jgi:hypothetical protein
MEIGKFKLAKANLIRPPKKPTSEFITREEAEAKFPGLFNAEVNENVVTKNYEAEEYINRIKSYMQSKYIDEDFGRQLVEKKLNEMEMAPSDLDTSRINRAIGGQVTERQNYSKGTPIKKALNTLIESGETSYEDLFALKDKIQEMTGSRPGGRFQLKDETYGDLLSQFDFESFATRSKATSPESYLLTDKQTANIVNKINKEFGLVDDNGLPKKGIKVNVTKTKQGKNAIQLYPNPKIYKGAKRMQGGFEESKINQLKDEIRKLQKTDAYKNYDKGIIYKNIGKESAITQLRNDGSKQDLIFDYLLKENKPITINQLAKKFKMSSEAMERDLGLLYKNIMRKASDKGGAFLPDDVNKLSSVRDTLKQIPDVDFRKDTVLNLIYDAYKGDPEKLTPMLNKVENFYSLQKKIPEEFRDVFGAQLDHIIPMNFLKQVDEGKDPLNLIRIQPLPTLLNNKSFKGNFDTRLGQAVRSGDQEVVKAFSELQKYLPTEFGGISPEGKIINFGAEPLTLERSLTQQQQKFGDVYKRVLNFIDNPKVQPLLEKAGINPETAFNVLRAGAAGYRKNLPAFLSTFRKILKDNPDLRVELGDEFADIENQYASASLMSDVSPVQQKTDTGMPPEAVAAGTIGAIKYGQQLLKILKNIGLKPFGSVSAGLGFTGAELASDDPSYGLASANLFLPEITGAASKAANVTSKAGRFLLNPFTAISPSASTLVPKIMTRAAIPLTIGGGIVDIAKASQPDYLLDKETGEPKAFERKDASFVMPTMIDANEQVSRFAKEKEISYQDAFKELFKDKTFREGIQETVQKYANGGRVNYAGGGMDMGGEPDSQGNTGPSRNGNNFKSDPDDNREQYGAQGQYSRPPSTPSDGGDNKINLINTLNKFRSDTFVNPYNYSFDLYKNIGPFGFNVGINTLGILGIDDPRTPEDESEQPDYGISAGYNTDLFGGTLGLGAGYSPTTGTNFGLNFSKQFNQGGRVGFADGPKDPGKRKFMKIMGGLASLPILGRFFDVAQVAEKAAPAVVETFKNAPAHFIGLVNKIRALGRIIDPKKLLRYDKEKFSNVYDYGDYTMYEKLDGGVEISKKKYVATDYGDGIVSEEYMSYNPKTPKFNKKGEKIPDEFESEYEEYTAYPDSEGKMKDIYESVEPSTIDEGTYSKEELEQLIVEQIENNLKKGKK